jgi:hypothetical protein
MTKPRRGIMLQQYCNQFLNYYRLAEFSIRSIKALTSRLNEFKAFLKLQKIRSVKKIRYQNLIHFVADFKNPAKEPADFQPWGEWGSRHAILLTFMDYPSILSRCFSLQRVFLAPKMLF